MYTLYAVTLLSYLHNELGAQLILAAVPAQTVRLKSDIAGYDRSPVQTALIWHEVLALLLRQVLSPDRWNEPAGLPVSASGIAAGRYTSPSHSARQAIRARVIPNWRPASARLPMA